MGTLYLLRHAKSSWDDPALADHDRPLAPRGLRNASALADHFRREELQPQLVLCSTALRARETLAILLPGLDGESELRLEDTLYGAGASELLARLHVVPETVGSVLVIGHNPGLESLAERLGGDDAPGHLPTSALVELEVRGPWSTLGSEPCRVPAVTILR